MENFPSREDRALIKAFASLNSPKEIRNFLRDLLTISEIKEFSNRFYIARLLNQSQLSYKQIAQKCHTSTTTVTRVNEWLNKRGGAGYKTALKRL